LLKNFKSLLPAAEGIFFEKNGRFKIFLWTGTLTCIMTLEKEQSYQFDQVYKANLKKVTDLARQRLRDKTRVADVVQDVFSVLYQNIVANNPIQNISAWLMGVTINKVRESTRKDEKFQSDGISYQQGGEEDEGPLYLHEILPDTSKLSDAQMFNGFIKEELEKALEELPEEQQWVFIQHELEDKSFKEMEEETGIPLKTLLSRKHYAVKALQKKLKQVYEEYKIQ
jgi:RNA polymerase sigma factor (sigma-70 family)